VQTRPAGVRHPESSVVAAHAASLEQQTLAINGLHLVCRVRFPDGHHC
jgi:hypothetical protein